MEILGFQAQKQAPIARDLMTPQLRLAPPRRRRPTAGAARRLVRQLLETPPAPLDAAWARAYLGSGVRTTLHAQPVDPAVFSTVSRRQAWQFQVMPLRREHGVLVFVTTEKSLLRAARFVYRVCKEPGPLLVADEASFGKFLRAYYPWPEIEGWVG